MYCSSCGGDIPLGVRFCNHCGAPTGSELMRGGAAAAADPDATRVSGQDRAFGQDSADPDATRFAGQDPEATRVASRLPFDERGAPSRVEQLPDRDRPRAAEEARREQQSPSPEQRWARPQPPAVGAPAERHANAERRPAATPGGVADPETERVIFAVRPTMLFIGLGYFIAAACAVGLTVLLAVFDLLPAHYSVLVALPLLLIPAYFHLRRNSVRYTLTDSKVEIDQGFLSRRTRNIPLRNIQDVTVAATIPQRLMRFGDLIIENANEVGGQTIMRNIPNPRRHADLLLRELRRWN